MERVASLLLLTAGVPLLAHTVVDEKPPKFTECDSQGSGSLHAYSAKDLDTEQVIHLSSYKGKVLLVVNVASF